MTHPYALRDPSGVASPALLFYPELIARNVARTVELAGSPARLRPHAKTHKTREIIAMQVAAGVTKHKVATLAEAEIAASADAADVLVAYPLVGPNPARLGRLARRYPGVTFASLIDCRTVAEQLSAAAGAAGLTLGYYIDLDVGMGRTGLPIREAGALADFAAGLPNLRLDGLHAYDGHSNAADESARESAARVTLDRVLALRAELQSRGHTVERIVAGGTPTFPMYARRTDVPGLECSPGTSSLHDYNYASRYPDYAGITPAAVLLTRVVSRPRPDRVTLDLGNKAVASEQPIEKRVHLLGVPDYNVVMHSEEHLVIETAEAGRYQVGDVVYGLPGHVCPTVALYEYALTVGQGAVTGRWEIVGRRRELNG